MNEKPEKITKSEGEPKLGPRAQDILEGHNFALDNLNIVTELELKELSEKAPDFFATNDFLVLLSPSINQLIHKGIGNEYTERRQKQLEKGEEVPFDKLAFHKGIPRNTRSKLMEGRTEVGVKMGSLYMEYSRKGKGSFGLVVHHLDFTNGNVRQLFNVTKNRYPKIEFSDLVPFSSLYGATSTGTPPDPKLQNLAHKIRDFITQMSLGKDVNPEQLRKANAEFLTAKGQKPKEEVKPATKKPRQAHRDEDIAEIAAKLEHLYYINLGVEKEELQQILLDYRNSTKKDIDEDFIRKLLTTKIDQNRYELRGLLPFSKKEVIAIANEVNGMKKPEEPKFDDYGYKIEPSTVLDSFKANFSPEQGLITQFKSQIRESIERSLSKGVNKPFNPGNLGYTIAKTLHFKPVENIDRMKELQSLVDKDKSYSSLEEFYSAINPVIKQIKPFGSGEFFKEIATIEKSMASKIESKEEAKKPT